MSAELDALLIEHLPDLNAAVRRLIDLETRVFSELDRATENWAEEHGWDGSFAPGDRWLAPPDWKMTADKDDEEYYGYFDVLGVGANDANDPRFSNNDQFLLTRILRAGEGKTVIALDTNALTRGRWKRIWKETVASGDVNVLFDDDGIYVPVQLDQTALSRALRNESLEEAFEPFVSTLDSLLQLKVTLDPLIQEVRNKSASSGPAELMKDSADSDA